MEPLEPADLADAASLLRAVEQRLPGIVATEGAGDWYLFDDPDTAVRQDDVVARAASISLTKVDMEVGAIPNVLLVPVMSIGES